MNIQLIASIQNHAKEAFADGKDESACRYDYGTEERARWMDAFALAQFCEESAA